MKLRKNSVVRALRGGGYYNYGVRYLRLTRRYGHLPKYWDYDSGFRFVVRGQRA